MSVLAVEVSLVIWGAVDGIKITIKSKESSFQPHKLEVLFGEVKM